MCFGSIGNRFQDAARKPAHTRPRPGNINNNNNNNNSSSSSSANPKASMPQDHQAPPSRNSPPAYSEHPLRSNPPTPVAHHDWQAAVPDTALLPPPPDFFGGFDRSPANNASGEQCEAGEAWCARYPMYRPMPLDAAAASAAQSGNVAVYAPPSSSWRGTLARAGPGVWRGSSPRGGADTCLASYPPLYHAAAHSPLATGRARTAYYEVRILEAEGGGGAPLALGYAAPPYPPFRLPGWHRGSAAVHGDDGHRYVNDRWGGRPFADPPFRRGETVGLGMEFLPHRGAVQVQVFLTRDGRERGRWDLHEETDVHRDLPVTGLEGDYDVCAAVGVFDSVAFEVVFAPGLWMWKGYKG
ncbi:hypothetical protein F4804DRAFT_124250 [Jackrogersella minutella]|nr:hypothetical protein F4804DRAFT_124250 [Jackrogersella minutella]